MFLSVILQIRFVFCIIDTQKHIINMVLIFCSIRHSQIKINCFGDNMFFEFLYVYMYSGGKKNSRLQACNY